MSVALNAEHRYESVDSDSTPIDQARGFFASNYTASHGRYSVNEGAIETVVPLAKDTVWAKTLEVNGAVRATGYSTFGTTATWKIGVNYSPVDDLRFRDEIAKLSALETPLGLVLLFSGTVSFCSGATSGVFTTGGTAVEIPPLKIDNACSTLTIYPRMKALTVHQVSHAIQPQQ